MGEIHQWIWRNTGALGQSNFPSVTFEGWPKKLRDEEGALFQVHFHATAKKKCLSRENKQRNSPISDLRKLRIGIVIITIWAI